MHVALAAGGLTPVLDGLLVGPDSYMRMLRVTHLYDTGAWFDGSIPRSNAPFGEVQHWTRPADLLLLGGAVLLEPLVGFARALFWWGAAVAPLLHVATALALAWAVAPFLDRSRQFFVVLALLVQMPVWTQGVFGRTDHHMLIMLVFALSIGGALRLMLQPMGARGALLAGAAAGFGLWLSVEFLVILAVIFAALVICWIQRGDEHAWRNLWHALGLSAVVAVALVAEHPPGAWLAEEYDRISVVHLSVGLLAAGFWTAVLWAERRGLSGGALRARVPVACLGALVAGGAMLVIFPKFFAGPEVDYDPNLRPIFLDMISETQPLIPWSPRDLGWLLVHLGPAFLAVPYLGVRLIRDRGSAAWNAWLLIALGLAVYIALSILMRRFSLYAALLLAVVVADLVAWLLDRVGIGASRQRRLLTFGLALPFIFFGPTMTGAVLLKANSVEGPGSCPIDPLVAELNRPEGLGQRTHTVLSSINHGPELLYRTRHSVVATPYPRNARGQIDAYRIYSATDFEEARRLIEARRIDLIVTCVHRPMYLHLSGEPDMLDSRLRRGERPGWLQPVELGEEAEEFYRIFEFDRTPAGGG